MENRSLYGGQAVIEGVMMRGPRFYAVACRRQSGEIVLEQESVDSIFKNFLWMKRPFLRGVFAMIDTLTLGMKALKFSADVAMQDTVAPSGPAAAKTEKINDITVGATMVFSLAVGVGIFIIGPHLLADLMRHWQWPPLWLNVAEGLVRLTMFVLYILGISLLKDIRRVWQYHGAEHKVVNTYEHGRELTPEAFAEYTTIHPRCGTNFVMFVLVLTIIVYSFLGWSSAWYLRIAYRLLLLPVIASIGYEVIRLAGRFPGSPLLTILLGPGMLLQYLTTRTPDENQIEVARAAFEAVVEKEESEE